MSHDPDIDDLLAPFGQDALRAALQEAFRRGEESMRARMLSVLGAPTAPPPKSTKSEPAPGHMFPDDASEETDAQARAPRGLAREVIDMILRDSTPLPTNDIQRMAMDLDERISAKTIYNELNRGKDKLYRLSMGRWSLVNPTEGAPSREEVEAWIGTEQPA
ncbi:MAG: hypothetical protein ABS77_07585 [Phenylobacterium sp. SCN 69-14]|nr:MAG: hypothetical protein ABS77_07585 [Phenylobacterium sp. SCN 69-14]